MLSFVKSRWQELVCSILWRLTVQNSQTQYLVHPRCSINNSYCYCGKPYMLKTFPGGSVGKESACNAGDTGDEGLTPGSGRALGGGHGNPLQYSCLGNPMDRAAWWATVRGVTKSWTWLKWLGIHMHATCLPFLHTRLPSSCSTCCPALPSGLILFQPLKRRLVILP